MRSAAKYYLLTLCLIAAIAAGVVHASTKERQTMSERWIPTAIPSIDAAAPAVTETATFALG